MNYLTRTAVAKDVYLYTRVGEVGFYSSNLTRKRATVIKLCFHTFEFTNTFATFV